MDSRIDALEPNALSVAILDVDGVLLASPHERVWRDALKGIADPARFTTASYQANVAGKSRLTGAVAALEPLGDPHAAERAPNYGATKLKRFEDVIHADHVETFHLLREPGNKA